MCTILRATVNPPQRVRSGCRMSTFARLISSSKAPFGGFLLAAGDRRLDRFRDGAIAIVIFRMQNLLDEKRPKRFERADDLNRLLRRALDEPAGIDQ